MERPAALTDHPLVEGLTPEQGARLEMCAREVHYPPGAFIFHEGGTADALYLIRSGRVALEQHIPGRGALQVENLKGGDILGLSWLFPDAHWTLDARAVEPTDAYALDAQCVHQAMADDPTLGCALTTWMIEQLYHRLMHVRLQRLDLYRSEV